MTKVLIVQATVQETQVATFLSLAKIIIAKSNAENGCLSYKLSKDLHEENSFFFYEKYKNEKAVEEHRASEHFKKFINSVMPLLIKEPIIELF